MKKLTVVALGPDKARQMTIEAVEAIKGASRVLLRTGRHGVAKWLAKEGIAFSTLDTLYDETDDFDTLAAVAAEEIMRQCKLEPSLCYAVPDPLTDESVAALLAGGVQLHVIAGVTQAALTRVQALEQGLTYADGICSMPATALRAHRIDPTTALLITEMGSRLLAGEVKLMLLDVYSPSTNVLLSGEIIPLEAIDRAQRYDHLTTLFIPQSPMTDRQRYTFGDLLEVMTRLRRPGDGCPWDREQTHETLREYIVEEAYELVEAIDQGDEARIADELGDVLLQAVFHAQVAAEHGTFTISDVTTGICHKMITRHAHIFGDIHCETAEDVLRSWEAIKKQEKGQKSAVESMRDIPGRLPALMRASKVQKKARQVGFDWDSPAQALLKVAEEADEVRDELIAGRDPEAELGDLLFAVVNTARLAGVQPELALLRATEKFIRRFEKMEAAILADGKRLADMKLPEMDVYWDEIKQMEAER